MEVVVEALDGALRLLLGGDGTTYEVLWRSLRISMSAALLALLLGLPLGFLLGLGRFPGRRALYTLINTGMALPPIVVGLIVTVVFGAGPLDQDAAVGSLMTISSPIGAMVSSVM